MSLFGLHRDSIAWSGFVSGEDKNPGAAGVLFYFHGGHGTVGGGVPQSSCSKCVWVSEAGGMV